MKIVYTRSVTRDVQAVKEEKIRARVRKTVEELKKAQTLQEVSGNRKMKGHSTAYRIRIGNYRLGLFLEKDTLILTRFLKRSDIYKLFP